MIGQRGDRSGGPAPEPLSVAEGEEVTVSGLADLPGAGYRWAPEHVPEGLALLAREWAGPVPAAVGSARAVAFRFLAERSGVYEVPFALRRPWEPPTVEPAERRAYAVTVRPAPRRG